MAPQGQSCHDAHFAEVKAEAAKVNNFPRIAALLVTDLALQIPFGRGQDVVSRSNTDRGGFKPGAAPHFLPPLHWLSEGTGQHLEASGLSQLGEWDAAGC